MKHVELQEFFVEGSDQKQSHILLHITEPSTPKEEKKGYFFALTEIEDGDVDQIEAMQEIIDEMENSYYEMAVDDSDSDIFETVLELINRKSNYVLDYNGEIHTIVGVLQDNKLSFSYRGDVHAFLFIRKQDKYSVLDILEEDGEDEEDQLYPFIVHGGLRQGDYFVIATPKVTDYFSYDRIGKILMSKNTKDGAQYIQKVLEDMDDQVSFGGIIIHTPQKNEVRETQAKVAKRQGSAESLHNLIESERKTAETLSPPIFGNLTKKIYNATELKEKVGKKKRKIETNYRPRQRVENESMLNNLLIGLGRAVVFGGKWFYNLLKTILLIIGRFFVFSIIIITNKNNGRGGALNSLKRKKEDIKESLDKLPLLSKVLFIATFVFAIIFISSIAYFKFKESVDAKKQEQTNLIQGIINKKDAANAAMLYGDENKAFDLLKEAREMLSMIEDENELSKQKASLESDIESVMMGLRKIKIIEPELLADFGNSQTKTSHIAMIENMIIAHSPDSGVYFQINRNTGNVEEKKTDVITNLKASAVPKELNKIVFIGGKNTIAGFENNTISSKDISYPIENPEIVNVFIYNTRLYTLDPANNQIYKHNRIQTGYDKGSRWIAEDVDISDAVSLAIDGDLFVLRDNGEILKFIKGKRESFELSGIDPVLEHPISLWTYLNIDYIYILEGTNKRVVVTDKQGKLVQQYTSNSWKNPTGMAVDVEHNKIYILDDNKIYTFQP